MSSASLLRRRLVPLTALAFAALLVALLVSLGPTRDADAVASHGMRAGAAGHTSATTTFSKRGFHDKMRKLWEQHVEWTRMAITDFAAGSGGFDATAARLLQNQVDIGAAIKPFFGTKAGNQLASLLHDHIAIAVKMLQAAKAGDTTTFNDEKAKWYRNANQIADFLSAANPKYWPRDMMRQMMKVHLNQTLVEASDELQGDFAGSVAKYDKIEHHMLQMADDLSSGIIARFPAKFR
ncbi:MAG TPA: hypothetical protein VFT62_04200 [Mycobacteriales bacterium]|nr:hypothetical protein [Mycobacteriales bacterium]